MAVAMSVCFVSEADPVQAIQLVSPLNPRPTKLRVAECAQAQHITIGENERPN